MAIEQKENDIFHKLEHDELYLEDFDAYLNDPGKHQDFFRILPGKNEMIKLLVLDYLLRSPKPGLEKFLVEWLNQEKNDKVIARLLIVIGELRHEEFLEQLLPFLKSSDRRVRANAVEGIGKIESEKIKEHLLPLLEDGDNRVRANAAMALWAYPKMREQVRGIFMSMLSNKDKWMQASALYAFGELGINDFLDYLFNYLMNEDEDICRNALIALLGFAEKALSGRE
ncbi:MAG: HEAT repeat domain-containing protein [Candidatus Wallbacteria bacterium]|nr:HEAT repeat domain-containing protein [Candidatus Wallbacteria bacterium]